MCIHCLHLEQAFHMSMSVMGGKGGGGPQPVILLLPQLETWIIESDDITKIGPIGQMAPVVFSHCFLN